MKINKFAFILLTVCAINLQTLMAQGFDPRRTITVSGSAEVKAAPDEVMISMSVETHNMSLDKAREENDTKVASVLTMVRGLGIENKYIQTDYLQAEPRYDERSNAAGVTLEKKFIGYYMTKHIAITLRDISKFETLISSAMKLGTNYINGTEFSTTELRKYRDKARLDAIRAAKEKAIALAGELGQKIGKPIKINEGQREYNFSSNFSSNAPPPDPAFDARWSLAPSIAPGELKITAEVTVTFELE